MSFADDTIKCTSAKLVYSCLTGYDPYANPPNYGNADDVVKENTNKVSSVKKVHLAGNFYSAHMILFGASRVGWFGDRVACHKFEVDDKRVGKAIQIAA